MSDIQTLCRTLKIMFWLYLGFLILAWPNGFAFLHKTPDGWMAGCNTYAEFSAIPWYSLLLVAIGLGLFAWAATTFYQLLALYERGTIFSVSNVRLLRRLGWLAVSFGLLGIAGSMLIVSWQQWIEPTPRIFLRDMILHNLVGGFFALLSSPWIMGGLFLLTISRVMLKGYQLQEDQELTV